MSHAVFQLSKHYLDCVTPSGDVIIVYAATLQWLGLTITYASILSAPTGAPPCSATSLAAFTPPQHHGGGITWQHPTLDFRGQWTTDAAPVQRTLLTTPEGHITWNCLAHRAAASISYDGRELSGQGYAEHLHMTLLPWQLPIEQLRWGRFISPTDSLVWIQWRGPQPLDLVLHNGEALAAPPAIDENGVVAPFLALQLSAPRTLRAGSLLTTALSSVPALARLFPRSILNTQECKWLSHGALQTPTGFSNGFAIHELVTLPKHHK